MKKLLSICILLLTILANQAWCVMPEESKIALRGVTVRKLLDVLQWDAIYDEDRSRDIKYLLGSIGDDSLTELTSEQKQRVIVAMQNMALNQLKKDRSFYKNYLVDQYVQFFTEDELQKLIQYYKTDVMQMAIKNRVVQKVPSPEDITNALKNRTKADRETVDSYSASYLSKRYTRFLDNVTPKLSKMIYERVQDILAVVLKEMPNIVSEVSK